VVETIRLESGHTLTGIGGSNPSLSASFVGLWVGKVFGGRWTLMRGIYAVVVSMLLAGATVAQQKDDWVRASNNPDILYRVQIYDRMKACYMEFRDQKQGTGNTTFDAAVDYNSTDLNADGHPTLKTDSEHIVTIPNRPGSSRIPNCFSVVEARVSVVQRH
jgi:hypothetical protein